MPSSHHQYQWRFQSPGIGRKKSMHQMYSLFKSNCLVPQNAMPWRGKNHSNSGPHGVMGTREERGSAQRRASLVRVPYCCHEIDRCWFRPTACCTQLKEKQKRGGQRRCNATTKPAMKGYSWKEDDLPSRWHAGPRHKIQLLWSPALVHAVPHYDLLTVWAPNWTLQQVIVAMSCLHHI